MTFKIRFQVRRRLPGESQLLLMAAVFFGMLSSACDAPDRKDSMLSYLAQIQDVRKPDFGRQNLLIHDVHRGIRFYTEVINGQYLNFTADGDCVNLDEAVEFSRSGLNVWMENIRSLALNGEIDPGDASVGKDQIFSDPIHVTDPAQADVAIYYNCADSTQERS